MAGNTELIDLPRRADDDRRIKLRGKWARRNAQQRRNGDTHVLNALRTLTDGPFAPGRQPPLIPSKLDAHSQTRLFRGAAKKRSRVPPYPARRKKWRQDTGFRHFRDFGRRLTSFPHETVRYAGVRTATKKYVRYEGGFEELFDLAADPYELKNVLRDPARASDLSALRGIHDTLKSCAGAACWVP